MASLLSIILLSDANNKCYLEDYKERICSINEGKSLSLCPSLNDLIIKGYVS